MELDWTNSDAVMHALVVATQQEPAEEKDMRLVQTIDTRRILQSLEGRLTVDRVDADAAMHALAVNTQQDLGKERDMRVSETRETRCLQHLEERLRVHPQDLKLSVADKRSNGIIMHDRLKEDLNQMKAAFNAQETLRLQACHEINDKVERLSGELEAVQRKCAAADDQITALTMVVKNSIEKQNVRQEKTDDHVKNQINNVKRELAEERCHRDDECSTLKLFVKNLEEQLSTHVKELRFNHEAEVNKRSLALEKLEKMYRELKDGLDAYDANHLEACTGLKNMIEQEIKAREKDTSNTERTFCVVSARLDKEFTTTSESMADLSEGLKRLCEELGREVQDRTVGDAAVHALVAGTQQELCKEKDMRLAETNATRCNLQSLEGWLKVDREEGDRAVHALVVATQQALAEEKNMRLVEAIELRRGLQTLQGCLTQRLQELKLNLDDERNNGIMMHDRFAEDLNQVKAAASTQEALRLQMSRQMNDNVERLSSEMEAVQRKCVGAHDEITALTMVVSDRLERLCDEVGREVQDRTVGDVAVRALVQQELCKEEDMRLAETSAIRYNLQSLEGRLQVNREESDKAVHALVVAIQHATQQALAEEKDMRLAEATELRQGLQTLQGCFTQRLQNLKLHVDHERNNGIMMHDRLAENLNQMTSKLSSELEAVRRECAAADDESTALTMVMKYSFENEKVERKNADNHINIQINNVKQELIEQRVEYDNECSMLKGFVKSLEEKLSTHVTHLEQLKLNHEDKVSKQSMAHKKLEQIHYELEGALNAHDVNHRESFKGLEKMIEQEIKARENDTSNTERTFSIVTAQFGAESSMMSESICDLVVKLERLSHELGTEVQDRIVGDAAVHALVFATQQELGKEKDVCFTESDATQCNLQSSEGRLIVDGEKADASAHALVVTTQLELDKERDLRLSETNETRCGLQCLEVSIHQELAKEREMCSAETTETRCSLQGLEGRLRVDLEDCKKAVHPVVVPIHQEFDKVQKLGVELVALQKERSAADDVITAVTMVMKDSIEKERVQWENADNDNKALINNIEQELTEGREESENDTSTTGATLSPLSQASDTEVRSRSTSWSASEYSQTT